MMYGRNLAVGFSADALICGWGKKSVKEKTQNISRTIGSNHV